MIVGAVIRAFFMSSSLWDLAKCRGVFRLHLSDLGQTLSQAAINEDFES